ncbi:MAG: extracellular solute-binding protein, partial [Spirochaetota bacterium]
RDHQEQLLYTSSDFDSIRLLLSGRLLLTSALEHQVLGLMKQKRSGASIAMYVPEFGAVSQTYGLAVPGNTKRREEALQFLQFITTAEAQQYMEQNLHVRAVPPVGTEQGKELVTPVSYEWWESLSPVIRTPEGFNYRWFVDSFTDGVLYR